MMLCSTTISAVYPGEVGYRLGRMPTYPTKHKRHISTYRTAHLVLQQHNASACSLSSGEAETYGVTKAFSRAIGMRNLANDLGFERYGELSLEVQTDSSAALEICHRRGCGRIRHLEAGCVWIQAALASKRDIQLTKVPGAKNTANILTKSVSRRDLDKHLLAMRLEVRNDRGQEVPQATVVERAGCAS